MGLPNFASSVLLCQEPSDQALEYSLEEVPRSCQFIHVQHRDTLVELLASPLGQGRRSLIIGQDQHTVLRLAEKLTAITQATKVVMLSEEDDELSERFSAATHLQTLLEKKEALVSDVAKLAEALDYKVFQDYTAQRAMLFFKDLVLPRWQKYSRLLEDPAASYSKLESEFPFGT